jgi:ComF family protein
MTAIAAARFVLPTDCLACRIRRVDRFFDGGVCETCWRALLPPAATRCARCDETLERPAGATALPADSLCGRCLLDPPAFRTMRAACPYLGSASEILRAFKFGGADYLAARLGRILCERLSPAAGDEVVAVPATRRAKRSRGYHPAEALAEAVAAALRIPFARTRLVKRRETEVQSRLPLVRRAANVRGAFRVAGRPAPSLLLVDDVATSGATARECAARLIDAGARAVDVWCFARASRTDLAPEPPLPSEAA